MVLRFHLYHYHFISKILTLSLLSIACGVGLVFPSSTVSDRDSYNTMCVALKLKVYEAEPVVSINLGQDCPHDDTKLEDCPHDVLKLVVENLSLKRLGRLGSSAKIFDRLCSDELEVRIQGAVERLEDSKYLPLKRRTAIDEVLSKLPAREWTNARVDTLVGWLKHECTGMRSAAIELIGKLPPGVLTPAHINTIVGQLENGQWYVRDAAVQALGQMPCWATPTRKVLTVAHVNALARRMTDREPIVREAAVKVLTSGSCAMRWQKVKTEKMMSLAAADILQLYSTELQNKYSIR